jgi:hypothetical protein
MKKTALRTMIASSLSGAGIGMGLFWPVGEMGGIIPLALMVGALIGAFVGGAAWRGTLSTATVIGLICAVFLGAWVGPGYDDRSGWTSIAGFLFGWGVYSALDYLTAGWTNKA